jgi:NADH:ubiquinone oxidoreductase subunit 2 (subunit N)
MSSGIFAYSSMDAFAVITLLPSPDSARDAGRIEDYRGLFRAHQGLSLAFAVSLLSLAGIPLTIGSSLR